MLDRLKETCNSLKTAYDLGCERQKSLLEITIINGDNKLSSEEACRRIKELDLIYINLNILEKIAFDFGCMEEY